MLEYVLKFLTFFITPTAGYFVIKNFDISKEEPNKFKVAIAILSLALLNFGVYNVKYNIAISIITFLFSIFVYKVLFNTRIIETTMAVIILFVLLTLGDVITSFVFIKFVDATSVRNNAFQMFLANILVAIITVLVSRHKIVKSNSVKFIKKSENSQIVKTLIFSALLVSLLLALMYIISVNYKLIQEYIVAVLIMTGLIILFLLYVRENNGRIQFENKYKEMLEYSKTFEDIIDNDKLLIHEYKNQLAAIQSMSNIKQVKSYINNILDCSDKISKAYIEDLKYLPKGGIKGTIYYKIVVATNKKLNVTLNVSKNVKDVKLSDEKTIECLIQALGICLDNAIEASETSKDKNLSIEIYMLKHEINVVICNTFDEQRVNLNKIENKGYSTKGKGRGNGLYFLSKIVNSQKNISTNWSILNQYFVRKIIIKL
mgnify:FL=1